MSRFYDCDDWDGEGMPPHLWESVIKRAMQGKRGKQVLREIREALLAMLEKKLANGVFYDKGVCCTLGAYAAHKVQHGGIVLNRGKQFERRINTLEELQDRTEFMVDALDTEEFGKSMGLTMALSCQIAWLNDEALDGYSEEERYEKMLEKINSLLEEEGNGAA